MVWYEVQRTLKSFSRAPEARLYTQSVAARYEKLFPIFALHSNQRPRLGYMDVSGKTIIAPRFSFGLEFLEGRAPVQVGKKWRFIDDTGEWAFEGKFGNAERLSEGLAYVIAAPRKYGFIDVNGKIAVEPKYRWAAHFSEERALVYSGKYAGFIDKQGIEVIPPKYDAASSF